MKYHLRHLENESGVALITGLVIMVLLTAMGTYAIHITEIEETLAGNLKASKQAFYLADAGLEWGRQQVRANAAMPANSTQTLGAGSYAVTFGLVSADFPFSSTVAIQSVGTVGNASKTLQAVVTKAVDLTDAAISIRGNEADSTFTGNAFSIDGRDYNHESQALSGGTTQYGISVPTEARQTDVNNALSAQQQDNIVGTAVPGLTASIGVSSGLPSNSVDLLGDDLCNAAPLDNRYATPENGSYPVSGNTTWGTRATPKVYCVTGVGTPGNMTVDISGNFSGVGVLVVRDADLVIHGAFHFEGLIIVTGAKVGFGLMGGGNKDIYGSVIINEMDRDGPSYREDVIQGSSSIRYSRSALNVAGQLIPAATLLNMIQSQALSTTVQQISWSEVNK
jgi:Tfp pilus assembly protein PilX